MYQNDGPYLVEQGSTLAQGIVDHNFLNNQHNNQGSHFDGASVELHKFPAGPQTTRDGPVQACMELLEISLIENKGWRKQGQREVGRFSKRGYDAGGCRWMQVDIRGRAVGTPT